MQNPQHQHDDKGKRRGYLSLLQPVLQFEWQHFRKRPARTICTTKDTQPRYLKCFTSLSRTVGLSATLRKTCGGTNYTI